MPDYITLEYYITKASVPTGLTAVSVTPYSVYLTWAAPALANGFVSSYTVLINWTSRYFLQYDFNTGSNTTTFNVTGLEACITYSFAVSATVDYASCTGPYSAALMNITTTVNSE